MPPPGRCEHPHPCEDVWPDGLEGPFELDRVEHVMVESHDGVELEGWIGIPDLPAGVLAPVALTTSPYLGFCGPIRIGLAGPCDDTPEHELFWTDDAGPGAVRNWGVLPIELVRRGFAVALFSVRGTGNSGGCFDLFGEDEQRDQVTIVDWLATADWSNGRVGAAGLSYRSIGPFAAAVQGLEPLKTIVPTGTIVDGYTATGFTPQGAIRIWDAFFVGTLSFFEDSALPPGGGGIEHATVEHLPALMERACPEVLEVVGAGEVDWLAQHRKQDFWEERSFLSRLPDMTASMLLVQGFRDDITHGFQDGPVWMSTPRAPKRQITGQWGHVFPWPSTAACPTAGETECSWFDGAAWGEDQDEWHEILFAWIDYWLKGEGAPPRLGIADHQDAQGDWHASAAWPPAEAEEQVLYLRGGSGSGVLAGTPGGADLSTRPAPTLLNADRRTFDFLDSPVRPWAALCPDPVSDAAGAAGLVYVSEPLQGDTRIAGNPLAYLELSSDQPGGTVRVHLAEIVGGSVSCDAIGQPSNVRSLTAGAADLRFHAGNLSAEAYETDSPAHVRVDLWDLAGTVSAGSRLAVVVSGAEPTDGWSGQPFQPEITVHAGSVEASQIVLPVAAGSTGGAPPAVTYPPRPFVPELGQAGRRL